MELPFKYFPLLREVIDEPVTIVIWAAFGIPSVIMVLALFAMLFNKKDFSGTFYATLSSIFAFVWIIGFIAMMILFFTGVSGEKLYFIWLLLFVAISIFSTINRNEIMAFIDEKVEDKKSKKKSVKK